MSQAVSVVLLSLACMAWLGLAQLVNHGAELKRVQATLENLKAERQGEIATDSNRLQLYRTLVECRGAHIIHLSTFYQPPLGWPRLISGD